MGNIKIWGQNWEKEEKTRYNFLRIFKLQNKQIGTIYLSYIANSEIVENKDTDFKILSMIYEYSQKKIDLFIIAEQEKQKSPFNQGYKTIVELLDEFPKTIQEKQERILYLMYLINPQLGGIIFLSPVIPQELYCKNFDELNFLLSIMIKKKIVFSFNNLDFAIVKSKTGENNKLKLRILENGWLYLDEKHKHENSKQVFIAMSFSENLERIGEMISKTVSNLEFDPLIIKDKQHNNEISGEILFEIKRSHFLIADVTEHKKGVYFEAGFAMGLGIPVIWCCKADDLDNTHFDTRQYNYVVWNDEKELEEKLKDRILGTILL